MKLSLRDKSCPGIIFQGDYPNEFITLPSFLAKFKSISDPDLRKVYSESFSIPYLVEKDLIVLEYSSYNLKILVLVYKDRLDSDPELVVRFGPEGLEALYRDNLSWAKLKEALKGWHKVLQV